MLRRLAAIGANHPSSADAAASAVPLHLLDTPHARALLHVLEEAARAAGAVDKERGWMDESGEPIG